MRLRLRKLMGFGHPLYLALMENGVGLVGLLYRFINRPEFRIQIFVGAKVIWNPDGALQVSSEGREGHVPQGNCARDDLLD